jgi:ergothioneine biosynthesis protein EgtB
MPDRAALRAAFARLRRQTEALVEPLEPEDCQVQSMPDASPAKWHLAHTTWFFETFVLEPHAPGHRPFHTAYAVLFNSYYNTVGPQHPRPRRGLLSRPTLAEVLDYRLHVGRAVERLLDSASAAVYAAAAPVVLVGLHHEWQHQELLLTDIKHALSCNPLEPAYRAPLPTGTSAAAPSDWIPFAGGLVEIGADGTGFAFDNERPRHRVHLEPYELASRLVTCGEYLEFMADGGYDRPELWLSDGWEARQRLGWRAPLYWQESADGWSEYTLAGRRPVGSSEPVCHVSYYEADAFARWAACRLPSEAEWEHAVQDLPVSGNLQESGRLHPEVSPRSATGLAQAYGDVWVWTQSPYTAYPGYRPPPGALGEYNGKFMCNQLVLRGGSCVSAAAHVRASYRNFFPPETRWQFSGLRLAR